jgi:hypothetical protein
MKIHLLTTTASARLPDTVAFWHQQGWHPSTHYNDGRFPSWGRNEILRDWYHDTDEEWCCIADDDITLFTDRNESTEFLRDPQVLLKHVPPQVRMITAMNGVRLAVNRIQQETPALAHNWQLEQSWEMGKIVWVRRSAQLLLQRTDLRYSEDHEWAFQHLARGWGTAICYNLVVRERGASTLFSADSRRESQAQRTRDIEHTQQRLMELYPEFELRQGVIQRKRFLRRVRMEHNIPARWLIPFEHKSTEFNDRLKRIFDWNEAE